MRPYREEFEAQQGQKHEYHKGLAGIWTPGFVKKCRAKAYFNHSKGEAFDYDMPPLFEGQTNINETLLGGMAYHVDREVVLSFGSRLSELGTQEVVLSDGSQASMDLVLQEVPADKPPQEDGRQVIVLDGDQELDYQQLEAALVEVLQITEAVSITKTEPDKRRRQQVSAQFKIPKEISWDEDEHEVRLAFEVKLPKEGKKNFDSLLPSLLGLVNGRPAQHYQNQAAAVIELQEMIFGKKKSVVLTVDGQDAEPDRFLGKTLAMLLTQTAGGIFEKKYFQHLSGDQVQLYQKTDQQVVVQPQLVYHQPEAADGHMMRISELKYAIAPYQTQYVEEQIKLDDDNAAYELREVRFLSSDGSDELMAISFQTAPGRGIRDLGFLSDREQSGRFKFRVHGQDGFAYGDFVVSPTKEIEFDEAGSPLYYTSVILTPRFSRDMRNKKIVLHVVQTKDGVYSETQVVPVKLVHPPEFKLSF